MASLRKRPKSDYWVCCYTTADGHRTQRSTGTMDKEEAMAVCRLWENEAVEERAAMEKAATAAPAKDRRFIWAAAAIAVLLQIFAVYWLVKPDESAPVSLFVELDKSEEVPAQFLEQQFALRHRWVRINEEAFEAFDKNAPEFMLNLFEDESHRVDVAAYRKHYTGAKSVVGLVENDLHSSVVLSRRKSMKGIIAGSIGLADGRRFLVTHGGEGKHVIIEVDMAKAPAHSAHPTELQRLRATPGASENQPAEGVGANDHLYDASEKPKTQLAKLDGKMGASQFVRGLPLDSLMAAAGINPSNKAFGFYGRTGAALTQGPTTPSRILYQRTGTTEFIDVMFVYENALLASFADEADLQLKIDNLVEDTNLIFKKCLIPLEVRQAILDPTNLDPLTNEPMIPNNTIFLAKARAWDGGAVANIDGLPDQPIGGAGPAWQEVTAPVKPVWDSTAVAPAIKTWITQPTLGVYEPLYETPAFNGDNESALDWISDARNSLIYGDQYWPEPYINLPEGYQWRLLPVTLDNNATLNTPPEARADFTAMDYTEVENPDIKYGPIDSGVYQPFSVDLSATGQIISPYGETGRNAVTDGTLLTTAELRSYTDRDEGGSLIGREFMLVYPLNRIQTKPSYYIRNNEDGNASYAPVEETVSGTIDVNVETFTALEGILSDGNNTALQQDDLMSLIRPLTLKWTEFNSPQIYIRDLGSSKYTFYYNQADSGVLSLPGLVAHYPFTGHANDITGNDFNGTVTGATLTTDRFGNADSAYAFAAGNNDRINIGRPITPATGPFSVSLWVSDVADPVGNNNDNANLIGNRETTNASAWWLSINSGGMIHFDAAAGSPQQIFSPGSTFTFSRAAWDHIMLTRAEDGNTTIYLNGTQVANGTNTQNINSAENTWIGRTGAYVEPFVGNMDDVRIFNKALTATEVADLFQAESAGQAPIDGFALNAAYDVVTKANHGLSMGDKLESNGTTVTLNVPYYVETIDENTTYLRTTRGGVPAAWSTNSVMDVSARLSGTNGDEGIDTFNFTLPHGLQTGEQVFIMEGRANNFPRITTRGSAAAISTTVERNTPYDVYRWNPNVVSLHGIRDRTQTPEKAFFNFDGQNNIVTDKSKTGDLLLRAGNLQSGLLAYYPFTGSANEMSGVNLHGIVTGATLTTDRFGNANSAYAFSAGNTDWVNIGRPITPGTGPFSVSLWVSNVSDPTGNNNNNANLVGNRETTNANAWWLSINSGGVIHFDAAAGSPQQILSPAATFTFSRAAWDHIMLTRAGDGNTTIYLNGTEVANGTNTQDISSAENTWIGRTGAYVEPFVGNMDDVRFYSKALTAAEVVDLYQTESLATKPSEPTAINDVISVAARYSPNNRPASPKRLWFADRNGTGVYHIRQVQADGTISIVAGGGVNNPDNNGTATAANFTDIDDIAVDGGSAVRDSSVYVAGGASGRVYKVDADGTLTLLAGSGTRGVDLNATKNGPAQTHLLGNVVSVAVDKPANNYYIADQNTTSGEFYVHRVVAASSTISRVIGGGLNDPDLNATSALNCRITNIDDITVDDSGRLYYADNLRGAIWRLEVSGALTKMAGSTVSNAEVLDGDLPTTGVVAAQTLAADASFLYFGGQKGAGVHRVRRFPIAGGSVTTMAGGGTKDLSLMATETLFGTEASIPNVTDVAVDSDGNVFFGDDDGTQSLVLEVNNTAENAFTWTDGEIVYIVDANATRPTSWPGLPPYDASVLPNMSDLETGDALSYFGPYWVNVDGNATTNPKANKFVLSGAPFNNNVTAGQNGSWTNLGTSNTQPFDQNRTVTFGASGQFYLVKGNSMDITRFWNGNTCDLVKTVRENLTFDDPEASFRKTSQVDFLHHTGTAEFSGASALEVQPGDFDPNYSGVVGDQNGTVGALRMALNTGVKQSGVRHFGPAANAPSRYLVQHSATGTFKFSTANYRVPSNSRDPRADVVCILVAGPGSGVGYYYGKSARGASAIPDMVEGAATIEDVKREDHPNVLTNRDSICFIACQWDGSLPYFTFAHELGHNLGAHHGVGDYDKVELNPLDYKTTGRSSMQPNITFSPYRNDRITEPTDSNKGGLVADTYIALGTYFTGEPNTNPGAGANLATGRFCTIMAYGGPRGNLGVYSRVGVFSSPFVYFQGTKTGEQFGWKMPPPISRYEIPLEFNNAKAISTVGPVAAYYRDGNGTERLAPEEVVIPTPPRGVVTASPSMVRNNPPRKGQSDGAVTYAPGVVPGVAAAPGPGGTLQMAAAVGGNGRQLGGGVNTQPTPPNNNGGTGLGAGTSGPGNTKKGGGGLGGTINPAPPPVKTVPGPPNDNWAKPMLFPARPFVALDATNRGATPEIGVELDQRGAVLLPQVGRPNCRSVWFRWDLPKQLPWTRVTFSTKGSQFDTTMKAFIGGVRPSLGTGIAHNDNVRQGAWSEIVIQRAQIMRNGQLPASVLICVDGVGGAQGQIRISARAE